jgi:hypothetical protein
MSGEAVAVRSISVGFFMVATARNTKFVCVTTDVLGRSCK